MMNARNYAGTFTEVSGLDIEPADLNPTPYAWRDPGEIPPRRWLYGRHYIRRYLTATVAPGALGKSSNAQVEAVAMVTGRNLLGVSVRKPLRVWYWNGEDPLEEIERKFAAIFKYFGITAAELGDRLFFDSGRDPRHKITIATKLRDETVVHQPIVEALLRGLQAQRIDCFIVDPFISSHGVPENDNNAIERVASSFAAIAERADCSIEALHHMRKVAAGGSNGDRTIDDSRGAIALVNTARSARVLNIMSDNERQRANVLPEHRTLHFRIDNGKTNMQPPGEKAEWRKLVSVPLGNATNDEPEDWVGVVTKWEMPGALDGITTEHLDQVREMVRTRKYRADSRASSAWVGQAVAEVLGLNLEKETDRAKVKAVLKEWFASGALIKVNGKDEKGTERPFVAVG
jgi:hypothetical protein